MIINSRIQRLEAEPLVDLIQFCWTHRHRLSEQEQLLLTAFTDDADGQDAVSDYFALNLIFDIAIKLIGGEREHYDGKALDRYYARLRVEEIDRQHGITEADPDVIF